MTQLAPLPSLHNLEVLRCVVEHQHSVRAAAQLLSLSPSAVSLQLAALERQFGTALFTRHGRRLVPTEAGQLVYRAAVVILDEVRDTARAIEALDHAAAATITFGCSYQPAGTLLPRLVSTFKQREPSAHVVLHVCPSEDLFQRLLRRELPFGITVAQPLPAGLVGERLRTLELVMVASPRYPAATRPHLSPEDLSELPFVCAPATHTSRAFYDQLLADAGVWRRHIALEIGHPEGIKQAVKAGLGIALAHRFTVEQELAAGELVALPVDGLVLRGELLLVKHPDQGLSCLARRFVDLLRTG